MKRFKENNKKDIHPKKIKEAHPLGEVNKRKKNVQLKIKRRTT